MITIQGSMNSAIVYAEEIESGAEGFLRALCSSPLSEGSRIRLMPDVHPARGSCVGLAMTVTDKAAPGLVGTDIGCGMEVFRIQGKRLEMQKLNKVVREKVPAGRRIRSTPHRFSERIDLSELRCEKHIQKEKALKSVGTLGGGNHFIEIDRGEDDGIWLIVHSGSRHLGAEVAAWYQQRAFEQTEEGIPYELAWAEGALLADYLHDLAIVQEFAVLNRQAIADEIIRGMKQDVLETFSTVHNYIDPEQRILRKGAVSAQEGEKLLIPLNMRDGCLLCVGKGNAEWNFSAPHGAGRKMSRGQVRQSFTVSQFKKEMEGIFSTSVGKETLDESPGAYKDADSIVRAVCPTVEIVGRLKPVYNFKAGEE